MGGSMSMPIILPCSHSLISSCCKCCRFIPSSLCIAHVSLQVAGVMAPLCTAVGLRLAVAAAHDSLAAEALSLVGALSLAAPVSLDALMAPPMHQVQVQEIFTKVSPRYLLYFVQQWKEPLALWLITLMALSLCYSTYIGKGLV